MKYLKTHEDYTKFRDTKKSLDDTIDKAREDLNKLDDDLTEEIIRKFKSFKLDKVKIDNPAFRSHYPEKVRELTLYFREGFFVIEDKYGDLDNISDYLFKYRLEILKSLEELTPEDIEKQRIDQEAKKFNL